MTRLAIRLLPWALCALSILFVLSGASGLFGKTEETPTVATAQALTTSTPPAEIYLKVTDGVLYWPEAVTHTVKKKGADESEERAKGYLVPLLSRADAQQWASLADGVKRPDVPHLVYASFTPEEAISLFPDAMRGAAKSDIEPFELVGTVTSDMFWPTEFKSYVQSSLGMAPSAVLLIDHGGVPLQKSSAAAIFGAGLVIGAGGFLWLRKRRRSAKQKSGGGVATGVRDGIAEGIEAGLAKARAGTQA